MSTRRITITMIFEIPGGQGRKRPYQNLRTESLIASANVQQAVEGSRLLYLALEEGTVDKVALGIPDEI